MGAVAAATARAMAQKIQRVLPGINYLFIDQHPLLKIAKRKGNIKYRGSHTEYEWFIYKDDTTDPTWGGGELSVNTFEEHDPATRAHLPYCWLQKNYGVSDRTMEANRHSPDRVYKPLGANLKLAQIHMYKVIGPAIYTGGSSGDGGEAPVGLKHVIGNAIETTNTVVITAASSYANKTLNTTGITSYSAAKAGFDEAQWAPEVLSIEEVPNVSGTGAGDASWSTDCLIALAYMEEEMAITADLTGTGESQKPDLALMNRDPFHALTSKVLATQATYGIPAQLVDEDLRLAGWRNIVVGGLTCIKDNNVPDDANATALERVLIMDSNQFIIKTTHTKAEGLIRNEFDPDNVMVNGVIGKLSANIGFYVKSPTSVGAILGCND